MSDDDLPAPTGAGAEVAMRALFSAAGRPGEPGALLQALGLAAGELSAEQDREVALYMRAVTDAFVQHARDADLLRPD